MKAADESRKGRSSASKSSGSQRIVTTSKPTSARKQALIDFGKTALKVGFLGLLFCAFFVAVWSGGASPVPVSGTVTYKGQPLPNMNVVCLGKGSSVATGTTDENGRFAFLTTKSPKDGAFPGDYFVAITPVSSAPEQSAPTNYDAPLPPPFPTRYLSTTTSPLRISVLSKGENQFRLELKD